MKKPNVLIVGAGPVGLTLAIECCRHGVAARIIDHNQAHSTQSKALAIWSGTLECFAAMGVVEDFLKVGLPIRHLVFADHGKILNKIPANRGVDSAYPTPIILPQSHTEEILKRHLASIGVTVERGVELTQFSQDDRGVTAELLKTDGSREQLTIDFLAGCDGARSIVRHQLALPFEGETESLGFVLVDAKVEGDLAKDSMFISWGATDAAIFFPVKQGVFRMFAQRKDKSDHSTPTLEEMQGYLEETGLGHLRLYDPEWLSYFGVNERVATRNRVGNVFLLGDASHIHSPAGGQGMNTGIQDAFNLGWKLKFLTKKMGNTEMIAESYFQERHPIAKNLVEGTTKLLHAGVNHTLLARITKDIFVSLFLHIPALQQLLGEQFSEMNIHYPSSNLIEHDSLSVDKRKHQAGWRVYEARVIDLAMNKRLLSKLASADEVPGVDGAQQLSVHNVLDGASIEATPQFAAEVEIRKKSEVSLWKECLHPQHTLLLFSGAYLSEERRLVLERLATDKIISKIASKPLIIWHDNVLPSEDLNEASFLDPKGKTHHRFGIETPSWILIRPDLYVAARGFIEETESLDAYCKKLSY